MFLMRILPSVLKELLKHVPTVLFDAVEWSELASEIPKITRKLIQKEGYLPLFNHQKSFLKIFDIHLVEQKIDNNELIIDKSVSEKWLTLYFAQLFSTQGVFLDLRAQYFRNDDDGLKWHPPSLWYQFKEPFRLGLINLYDGFYLNNEQLYHKGLVEIGLAKIDWAPEDKMKLAELFKEQFGASIGEEISFNLEGFKKSLIKITNFLLEKKVVISNDFLFLGVYLVLFYSAMEKGQEKLPVKDIYLSVRNKISNP